MGLIYTGIPKKIALQLAEFFNISCFVETGTYKGSTAIWAANHFEQVITIEASLLIYQNVKNVLGPYEKIDCILGDSAEILKSLVLPQPALFWLDAHYMGGGSFAGKNPLIEEISIINQQFHEAVILIDDARFILSKWCGERYCELDEIINMLYANDRHVSIFEDVIIAVPNSGKDIVDNYINKRSEIYWKDYLLRKKSNRNIWLKAINKIFRTLNLNLFLVQSIQGKKGYE